MLKKWVNNWKLVNTCISNLMKAEIMIASLTTMAKSQLHNIFRVAKTGIMYTIRISNSDKLVKSNLLVHHTDGLQFVLGFKGWGDLYDSDSIYPMIDDEHHGNYAPDPLKVKRAGMLNAMIQACRYHQEMASMVHMLGAGLYNNLLLLFKNHLDIFDTLKTFKNVKHLPACGPLIRADKQAFSALPHCGCAALHYLCMSLNLPNPFFDTELWL